MNHQANRDAVIDHCISHNNAKDTEWLGTWYVRKGKNSDLTLTQDTAIFDKATGQPLKHIVNRNISRFTNREIPYKIFTVCILYDTNLVHYVSFVYDAKLQTLYSFDPGMELYLHGLKTIIPGVRKIFHDLKLANKSNSSVIGRCNFSFRGKKPGIQFNGEIHRDLPADAFCQTWTLFFLTRLITLRNMDFVTIWCQIPPARRESYLVIAFIIPLLENNETISQSYFKDFSSKSVPKIMNLLSSRSLQCLAQ
jgi:hypothetical protein